MQLKALSGATRALAPGPTVAVTQRCAGAHRCRDSSLRRGPPLPGLIVAPGPTVAWTYRCAEGPMLHQALDVRESDPRPCE